MKRRKFIISAACAVPGLSLFPPDLSGMQTERRPGVLERRALGRTGEMLSIIGFGGIVVRNATPATAAAEVAAAIKAGVNYFDVAPSYGDAEIKLGPALEPWRKEVFLACKTGMRSRDEARHELEQSLINLRTDHFDLYQHHAVTTMEDVEKIFAQGGAQETFLKAKEEGMTRFLGFTAHSVEAALAMMDRYDFDTILFPFNWTAWYAGNFGPQVMARAKEKGMGILALKSMARGPWKQGADRSGYPKCWYEPLTSPEDILMGLRFTLSHPVTAAVPPGDENLFRQALALSDRIKPLSDAEIESISEMALKGTPLFKA
ncbi:MAG: aldo/keto reductase [Actinomycetota bacterium]|jgi:predicted aldo/keto reductase-like oxidoreductase